MIPLFEARTPADLDAVRVLLLEYADILRAAHCLEGFDEELRQLPGDYSLPRGTLLLARQEHEILGCVAVRPLDPDTAEMKRLYVRPAARGHGVGRILATGAIDHARRTGYRRIRLDTLPSMTEARQLYISLGFHPIPPYRDNPVEGTAYLELDLSRSPG